MKRLIILLATVMALAALTGCIHGGIIRNPACVLDSFGSGSSCRQCFPVEEPAP